MLIFVTNIEFHWKLNSWNRFVNAWGWFYKIVLIAEWNSSAFKLIITIINTLIQLWYEFSLKLKLDKFITAFEQDVQKEVQRRSHLHWRFRWFCFGGRNDKIITTEFWEQIVFGQLHDYLILCLLKTKHAIRNLNCTANFSFDSLYVLPQWLLQSLCLIMM